jgi:hypothetical protein
MTSLISVTCPQATATSNRRKNLQGVYSSSEWEKACDAFLVRGHIKIKGIIRGEGLQVGEAANLVLVSSALLEAKKPCEWCGTKVNTLVHHGYLESYKDGSYLDLNMVGCVVLCGRCHYAIHNDLELCKCGKYTRRGNGMCRACFDKAHPDIRKAKDKKIADGKALQKRLRDEEKERVKQYKLDHPKPKRARKAPVATPTKTAIHMPTTA